MASVSMLGLPSVLDRTIFTHHGPIVKRPLPILSGSDLQVVSKDTIEILSASFTSADLGRTLEITGSTSGRNDGTFRILEVLNSVRVRLENVNFDVSDVVLTSADIVSVANVLRAAYSAHLTASRQISEGDPTDVHFVNDTINVVTAPLSSDLASAIVLVNDLRSQYLGHLSNAGGGFHSTSDVSNVVYYPEATNLPGAVLLVNELLGKYNAHRIERKYHQTSDPVHQASASNFGTTVEVYPGSLTGPFTWILYEPRFGETADDASDVEVYVNGSLATVEDVFGLLGAVILASKPFPSDTVTIDYDYVENPPARFLRPNSFEYVLNQDGNGGLCGLPSHRYRARSYVIDPGATPDLASAFQPKQTQWKYKALERAYTAAQNDSNLLLLNSPVTKVTYDVLHDFVQEYTIRYDPTALPQNSPDPWELKGDGTFTLSPDGDELTIEDDDSNVTGLPPFFTHEMEVKTDSNVSAAFRAVVEAYLPDSVFTGIAFALSDGEKVALAGFIQTEAIGLSSVMARANDLKSKFNSHLSEPSVHNPDDVANVVEIVDADDLESAIILLNDLKSKFNTHAARGDATGVTVDVHVLPDTINNVAVVDATDLNSAVALANAIADRYDAHRVESEIHWSSDTVNTVDYVKQIGILTNSGFYELQDSWVGYSTDWEVLRTYRLYMSPDGDASLYVSGSIGPVLEVPASDLPPLSSLDGKFDPLQQAFFGSITRDGESISKWSFIRVNVNPVDANLIGDNKSVTYDADQTPELADNPWTSVGQGGAEWVNAGILTNTLILDSTCSLATESLDLVGLSSGTYRGFLRFEPILTSKTTCIVDFKASVDHHTFGVGETASGVYLDDGTFAIHFAFLYFFPIAATVTGGTLTFSIAAGDKISFSIDGDPVTTVTFPSTTSSVNDVVSEINSVVGFTFASNSGGYLKLTSSTVGAASQVSLESGIALVKLGFGVGKYFGSDSSPEDRFAWYGNSYPDLENPSWGKGGGQSSTLLERTLRVEDDDASDYLSYTMSSPNSTEQVIKPSGDWRVGFRLTVRSYTAGDTLSSLDFAGALVALDEGPFGKNLDLHLCVDTNGNGYVHLVSYNPSTVAMDSIAQYPCAWNDGQRHSFEIIANKTSDSIFILWNGVMLTPLGPSPTYTGLNAGSGPLKSLTFGSGGDPIGAYDLRSALSVVDWESVWMFRDTKLNDLDAPLNRYVGLYKGGDPSLLASWYLHQVDWSAQHVYRIVRNPLTAVSVFVDGSNVPSISVNYDVLTFPQSFSSFLTEVTNGRSSISFGSFDPQEISRTRWDYVRYSMGKLTITDRLVPPHQVSNQANVIASPEHIRTSVIHDHYGFTSYSGGTPLDDFMADEDVTSFTTLGEGVPPVPMTQDLESRGGLVKNVTPAAGVDPLTFVNSRGFLGDFVDDTFHVVTQSAVSSVAASEASVLALANDLKSTYDLHLVEAGVHNANDLVNGTVAPVATDLASTITLLNDVKAKYGAHKVLATAHVPIDTFHPVTAADATDLSSAADLANDIASAYGLHIADGRFHALDDGTNVLTATPSVDRTSAALLADDLRIKFTAHATNDGGVFHSTADTSVLGMNFIGGLAIGQLPTLLDRVEESSLRVQAGDVVQFLNGPNAVSGSRIVTNVVSSTSFDLNLPLASLDTTDRTLVRLEGATPAFQTSAMIALANDMRFRYNRHLSLEGVHDVDDVLNLVSSPNAFDVSTAVTLLNEMAISYAAHQAGYEVHPAADATNVVTAAAATDPLADSVSLANDLKSQFNSHVLEARSHVNVDEDNSVTADDAADETTLIDLVNDLKSSFNAHRTAESRGSGMHVEDDLTNVVTAAIATDLATAVTLANDVQTQYGAHRVQEGVHGSSVFIRLDPPSRVLYNAMKFWVAEDDGIENVIASFSDDETLYLTGAVKSTDDKEFSYVGTDLPERTSLLSVGADAAAVVAGDTLQLEVDGAIPTTITLQAGDVTAALVAARVNSETSSTIASDVGTEIQLTSPTTGTGSSMIVSGGTAVHKLGLSTPQQAVWHIVSDDPTAVSVTHMGTFVRYGTTGATTTAYRNEIGIGGSISSSFEVDITMRVNSTAGSGPTFDSGIFAGLSGTGGANGYSAAIGFEKKEGLEYVKIQDVQSGEVLYRALFDWDDGAFHTYRLSYDADVRAFSLTVVN